MSHLERQPLNLVRIQTQCVMNHIVACRADSALIDKLRYDKEVIPAGKQFDKNLQ